MAQQKKSTRIRGWSLPGMICIAAVVPPLPDGRCTTGEPGQDQGIQRARQLVQLLVDGKFDDFMAASTKTVQEGLPGDKLKEIWVGIQQQFGPYQSEFQVNVETQGGMTVVTLASQFEKMALDLKITLDADGKVAGFFMVPNTSRVGYEPPAYVDRSAFGEEPTTVTAGSYPLPGTISVPTAAKPADGFPGVVLVHGSGPHDQDETVLANKPFRDLAWGLATKGIAVLRYEKRTHKYPNAHTADNITLDDETIDDAVAAARLLGRHPAVDPHRVFVLGHSLGGVAVPFIAHKAPELAGIIALAGCARPLADVVADQFEYIAGVDGQITPEERAQLDQAKKELAAVRDGQTDGEPIQGLPRKYLCMMNNYDPVAAARKLDLPLLIVQGGRDYQVTMKDWDLWQQGLTNQPNVTFQLFDDCNHLFLAGQGPSSPAEYQTAGHVAPEVIDYLAKWMTSTAPAR